MKVRVAELEEILPLRQAVIIEGTNRTSPDFPGDRFKTTIHIGAFRGDECIGCASFYQNDWQGQTAWQLRGMATAPEWRNRGIGKALLLFTEAYLPKLTPIHIFWCNARTAARHFYEKNGWRAEGEEFIIQGVGPHYEMVKELPPCATV